MKWFVVKACDFVFFIRGGGISFPLAIFHTHYIFFHLSSVLINCSYERDGYCWPFSRTRTADDTQTFDVPGLFYWLRTILVELQWQIGQISALLPGSWINFKWKTSRSIGGIQRIWCWSTVGERRLLSSAEQPQFYILLLPKVSNNIYILGDSQPSKGGVGGKAPN